MIADDHDGRRCGVSDARGPMRKDVRGDLDATWTDMGSRWGYAEPFASAHGAARAAGAQQRVRTRPKQKAPNAAGTLGAANGRENYAQNLMTDGPALGHEGRTVSASTEGSVNATGVIQASAGFGCLGYL